MRTTVAVAAVTLLVALAGCGGLTGDTTGEGPLGDASPSVESVSAPESLAHDERATVEATVRWEGIADGGGSASAEGSNETLGPVRTTVRVDGTTLLAENRSVPANGTMTVTAMVDATTLDPGEHELGVSVEEPRAATFVVSDVDVPDSVDYGADLSATATVTNVGDVAGNQTVRIRYGTGASANRTVALDGGAETRLSVSFAAVRLA